MKDDCRSRCNGVPRRGGLHIPDAEGNGEVGPFAPEGAFLLMEDGRLRRIRGREDPGVPEDPAGKAGAVQVKHGPDAVGVFLRGRAVADDDELVFQRGADNRGMDSGTSGTVL